LDLDRVSHLPVSDAAFGDVDHQEAGAIQRTLPAVPGEIVNPSDEAWRGRPEKWRSMG
jgi:hypothetical protein